MSITTGLTGIDLARLADLPLDVLVESRRVAERLADLQTSHEESSESRKIAIRRKALLRVIPSSVASSCVYSCKSPSFIARLRYCGRCYPVDSDISSFFLDLILVHHLIAPDAINSGIRTFCSTRQGPLGIYWTIPN